MTDPHTRYSNKHYDDKVEEIMKEKERGEFQVSTEIVVEVLRIIKADSIEDAREIAEAMNADEWLYHAVGERIEYIEVGEYKE